MSADYSAATVMVGGESWTLLQLLKERVCQLDDSRDQELSFNLQVAGEAAERYCNTALAQSTVTDRIAKSYYPVTLLSFPVVALVSVLEDGEDVTADWELFFDPGTGDATANRTGSERSRDYQQLDIEYTAGYEPLPADLANAIVNGARAYEDGGTAPVKKETIVGVGSVEYIADDMAFGAFNPAGLAVLDTYKRLHV